MAAGGDVEDGGEADVGELVLCGGALGGEDEVRRGGVRSGDIVGAHGRDDASGVEEELAIACEGLGADVVELCPIERLITDGLRDAVGVGDDGVAGSGCGVVGVPPDAGEQDGPDDGGGGGMIEAVAVIPAATEQCEAEQDDRQDDGRRPGQGGERADFEQAVVRDP